MVCRILIWISLIVPVLPLAATAAVENPAPTRIQDLEPTQQATAREVIESIWSPYCPGMTLESCTSGKAEVFLVYIAYCDDVFAGD